MIKHNEKSIEIVSTNIARIKEYSAKLAELNSPEKEIFWKALQTILTKSKDAVRDSIIDTACSSNLTMEEFCSRIKFLAGSYKTYEESLNIVDKNDEALDEANARLKELINKKKEVENNIEMQ
jgi:protein-arginine kinase activator protein McsA